MDVLSTVFSIFILLFIGYGLKKARILQAEDAGLLNTLVLNATLPAFIFNAIYSYRQPLPFSIAKVPIIGFAMIAVTLGIAYAIGRLLKVDRPTLGGMVIASAFGNTGFLGYPVTQAVFSHKLALVTATLYDELAMALPLYTIGIMIAARFAVEKAGKGEMLNVLKMPSMLAIPVAFFIRPLVLPAPILSAIQYLAAGTVPLVMVSLGLALSARSLKGYAAPALVVCILKLGLLPLLTYSAFTAGGVSGVMHQVGVLESGMPSAVMTCVVAAAVGVNDKFVAGVIFVSTLLSIATIPVTLLILGVH